MLPTADGKANKNKEEQNGIVQAIVRIHSLQSLQHVKRVTSKDRKGKLVTRELLADSAGREVVGA